jgi:DNA-binding GntR family transcriptional regulator
LASSQRDLAEDSPARRNSSSGFPALVEQPRRLALADDVYEKLKSLVMNLQVAPGSKINMDALARELDVSITPIRESLSRLESDGLVVKMPMRGYVATPVMSAREFEDLYTLRLLLEPWAAGQAAARATPADIETLVAVLRSCPPVPEMSRYEGYRAFANHDARFHEAIHELAGNAMITAALQRTHAHIHLFRLNYERKSGAESVSEHQAIFDAISSGDTERAEQAMTLHLTRARDRLRRTFGRQDGQS